MPQFYVQKKEGFDFQAQHLCQELREILSLPHLEKISIIQIYLLEGVSENLLEQAKSIVFCEAQVDELLEKLDLSDCKAHFVLQTLQGQFDPRKAAALDCLKMLEPQVHTPLLECATLYKLYGELTKEEQAQILSYLSNPLENQAISLPLSPRQAQSQNTKVENLKDFATLQDFNVLIQEHNLSLSPQDLKFIQEQVTNLNLLELKILDTYWSDHCRHTTFFTEIDFRSEDPLSQEIYTQYLNLRQEVQSNKPITLMDLSTLMAKSLKHQNKLKSWVQGEENNACTLAIDVKTPQGSKPYYLFFKNETHNHPTEIEPFGGASTCIGGAIRDPLSARGYVYAGIRISGSANPLESIQNTRKGKLPQRKIALTASEGFSSYGNQIGVPTGLVSEFYHEGYKAKHLELGAVLAAAPRENVRSLEPKAGDVILLVGGKTGRDGCGGASGSSKSHHSRSLELCGAEVQKGDAPEERKLQRLMRHQGLTRMIKRCNDFGAGGVSVAVPELAGGGVEVYLDSIPTKYTGLSAYDLALSESQERMAMLISPQDLEEFKRICESENLQATLIAKLTGGERLEMYFQGEKVVDLPIPLLQSHGAKRRAKAYIPAIPPKPPKSTPSFLEGLRALASDLNFCSQRGLIEKFDSTIGSNTVWMPLGGKYQATAIQAMAHTIPFEETSTCSLAAFGFDPYTCEEDCTRGAYLSVVQSVSRLIASGAEFKEIYLSFQEYFESLGEDEEKWGKPFGVLLGAFLAQKRLGIACIGGKDSMSGSFEDLSVPPSFVSFAFCVQDVSKLISPEFKAPHHFIYLLKAPLDVYGLPDDLPHHFARIHSLIRENKVLSAYALGRGGVAEALIQMSLGNRIGVELEKNLSEELLFEPCYGGFVLESQNDLELSGAILLGKTSLIEQIQRAQESLELKTLESLREGVLQSLYPTTTQETLELPPLPPKTSEPKIFTSMHKFAKPRVLLPIFPGTNCEYDTQKAFERAGAEVQTLIISNLSPQHISQSIAQIKKTLKEVQILFIPGGFSGGDEPDGSAKLIKSFFFNPELQEGIQNLLEKQDGLIGGICNGFQALIKLGLLPFGKITISRPDHPTLLHNAILRHQSKIVQIKVLSNASPWLSQTQVGEVYSVPISHGEGRFFAPPEYITELAKNGQIATQYVDLDGRVSQETDFNPNGSLYGIEGILSNDGRVFGKMGHTERYGSYLYKNIPGNFEMKIFEGAVAYYR